MSQNTSKKKMKDFNQRHSKMEKPSLPNWWKVKIGGKSKPGQLIFFPAFV